MKKILAMSLMLVFALMVSAQSRGGRFALSEEAQAKWYEEMTKELSLKPAQLDSIKAIDKKYNDEMTKAREGGGGDREAWRAIGEKRTESVKKVLTSEQFTKYEAMQAKRREEMRRAREQN